MEAPKILFAIGEDPERVEVMRLTRDGFVYNGETISDAGAAYNLFVKFMRDAGVSAQASAIIQRLYSIAVEAIGEEELELKLLDLAERVH